MRTKLELLPNNPEVPRIEFGDPALTWATHVAQSAVQEMLCMEASWKFHEALLDHAEIIQIHFQEEEGDAV